MKPATTDIGRRIDQALGRRRISDIAREAGLDRTWAWDLRHRAKKQGPTLDTVARLAAALGVTPAWLGFGSGPMRPEEVSDAAP